MEDIKKEPIEKDCENCCAITDVKILRNGDYEFTLACGKKEVKRK